MFLSEFKYELPARLIAQKPAERRTDSRLMVVDRARGIISHDSFANMKNYLLPGDCLVLNDTRVIPARLYGRSAGGIYESVNTVSRGCKNVCGRAVDDDEILLLREIDNRSEARVCDKTGVIWEVMVKPGRRFKEGADFLMGGERLRMKVIEVLPNGNRVVRFDCGRAGFFAALDEVGHMPLPPYIKGRDFDEERYQTVYSNERGSVAAPTAGLHFTREYLDQISTEGVDIAYITLHVGQGTFAPVKAEIIEDHHMHSEYYRIDELAADKINRAKEGSASNKNSISNTIGGEYMGVRDNAWLDAPEDLRVDVKGSAFENEIREERIGSRVVSIGTTSVRTLESVADGNGFLRPCDGCTDIFIYPGYKFRCVDALLTNFHLPGSTLLMLVCAFAGYDVAMEAYRKAVEAEYRFFSFGDAMLIY